MAYAFAGVQYAIVLPSFYLVAIVLDYGVIGGWVVANLGTVVTSSIVLKILNSVDGKLNYFPKKMVGCSARCEF